MAEDHRDDRYGQAYQPQQGGRSEGQNQYGQAGGYSPIGREQPEQRGYGGQGWDQRGWDRPQAWQQGGQGEQRPHGGYGEERWGYGAGQPQGGQGYGQSYGQGYPQGPARGFGGGEPTYTGQTGTGYGRTLGGDGPDMGQHDRSWWEKTRDFLTGDERQGPHRGRGPKSYTRSDDRIRDDVNDRLTDDPFLDATDIEVSVAEGQVTLSGTVSSRADKRRAEDLADNVSGVKDVQNNLRVVSAASS